MLTSFLHSRDGGLLIGGILLGVSVIVCWLIRKRYGLSTVEMFYTLLGITIITIVLIPWAPIVLANTIGPNSHPVSFITGPALYSRFGHNMVPGLDYFTQYSVGLPFIFSFFTGRTGPETVFNYVVFFVIVMWLFCISSYCVLFYIFKSRFWALGLTLVALVLQFHFLSTYSTGISGFLTHFADPSSHFFRFPLLVIIIVFFVQWGVKHWNFREGLILACLLGFSLYWNTETGVYMLTACCLAPIVISGIRWDILAKSLGLVGGGIAGFIILSLVSFGWRVLSVDYLWEAIAPLVIYSGGFSALRFGWGNDFWSYVMNFLTPMLGLASLGWAFRRVETYEKNSDREQVAFVALISLLTLFMQAKYLNRSLSAEWYVNAYPALILFGWWLCRLSQVVRRAEPALIQSLPNSLRGSIGKSKPFSLAFSFCTVLVVSIAIGHPSEQQITGQNSDYGYGLSSYTTYPSLLNVALGIDKIKQKIPTNLGQWKNGNVTLCCDEADIRLIQDRVPPQEPVAIMSDYDWAYLIAARRAPLFPFLPSTFTFTTQQLNQITQGAYTYIFLVKGQDDPVSGTLSPDTDKALTVLLEKNFVKDAEGVNLVVYISKKARLQQNGFVP